MILLGCYAPQYSTVGGYQDMLRKLCGYDTMPNRQQEIAGRGQKTQRGGRRGTQAEKRGCTQRIGGALMREDQLEWDWLWREHIGTCRQLVLHAGLSTEQNVDVCVCVPPRGACVWSVTMCKRAWGWRRCSNRHSASCHWQSNRCWHRGWLIQQVDQQVGLDWKAASIGSCDDNPCLCKYVTTFWIMFCGSDPQVMWLSRPNRGSKKSRSLWDSAADEERRRKEEERKKRSGLFWGYLVVVVFPQVNWPLKRNMPCGNQTWQ